MTAIGHFARPRLITAAALLGVTLAGGHEPREPRPIRIEVPSVGIEADLPPAMADLLVPPAMADARPWPRGMVIAPPATGDRMATNALATLVSGLIAAVRGLGA